jgi:microcystin degradation protein MlrC
MKLFIAALGTETNTFVGWPTARANFEENGVCRGDSSDFPGRFEAIVLQRWRLRAQSDGHEIVEGLATFAEPGGPTVHSVYEAYRDEILRQLASEAPLDVVLLLLHGAMVSTVCDDCEGDLITRARAIVGPEAVIGVELDPHAHLTAAMVENSDAIVFMKEYPHDDFEPRADELYDICARTAAGQLRPTSAVFDCRMVGFFPTTAEPMAGLLRHIRRAEQRPGVVSISFVHGFPWGDTPDTGAKVLAITDGDPDLATAVAEEIGRAIYLRRDALLPGYVDLDGALAAVAPYDGLSVLADTADNAGGGAPGDNTALLRGLLANPIGAAAVGPFWDPVAASLCAGAGEGATLPLRLGGKMGPTSGDPLDLIATVRSVRPDFVASGLGGSRVPMGLSVWVELEPGVDIVICSIRTQGFHPDLFTGLGVDLTAKRIVIVKSSQHYYAGFSPIAARIIPVSSAGALNMDFGNIRFLKKVDLDYHPRVADPLGLGDGDKGRPGSNGVAGVELIDR